MRLILVSLGVLFMTQSASSDTYRRPDIAMRPAHTFSIVARDPETGELGAAVQSHWFSTGSVVVWAEPGVGAVATQSFVEVSYGPEGLKLMRAGKNAQDALDDLLAKDEHTNVRQVGMVDAKGIVAVHTGDKAIVHRCHEIGANFSVQANMMHHSTVCTAMKAAFEATTGDLAERMMAALDAAQREGGDIRGKQSAAMIVVEGDSDTPSWKRKIDLSIEDHKEPLKELRRLIHVARTYALMTEGDELMADSKVEEALAAYTAAEEMSPDNHEAIFWHAATLAAIGRVDEALPLFTKAYAMQPTWKELVQRLPAAGLLPDDPEMMAKILDAMED